MTKLSATQIALLTAAAKARGGTIDTPDGDKPAARGLLTRTLMTVEPRKNGGERLKITTAGRLALTLDPGPAEDANASASAPADAAAERKPTEAADAGPAEGGDASASAEPALELAETDDTLSASEPAAGPKPPREPKGKIATVLALLRRPEGADIDELMAATGWQAHSVRGALSGAIKKKPRGAGLVGEGRDRADLQDRGSGGRHASGTPRRAREPAGAGAGGVGGPRP